MAIEITSETLAGAQSEQAAAYKGNHPGLLPGGSTPDKSASRSRFWHPTSEWPGLNFSSRASALSGGEVIILSVPKSGRTWIRAFLCAYLCKRHGLEFTLKPGRYNQSGFPRVIFSHDLFEHRTKGDLWDRLRGKYLVPRGELSRAKIILLARDPRDCLVSHYLQLTRRDPHAPVELRRKSVSEMLRDRTFGVHAIVNTMNDWIEAFSGRDDFIVIRYESLRASPAEYFRDLLAVLGESAPDMTMFHDALEFSRFENMQKLEAAGAFDSKILNPCYLLLLDLFTVHHGKV